VNAETLPGGREYISLGDSAILETKKIVSWENIFQS